MSKFSLPARGPLPRPALALTVTALSGSPSQGSRRLAGVFALLLTGAAIAAAQDVHVQSPPYNTGVTPVVSETPYLQATSTTCKSSPTVSMGYSFDSSTTTYTFAGAQSLELVVPSAQKLSPGPHTINLKAWSAGNSCYTAVPVTVADSNDSITISQVGNNTGSTPELPVNGETLYSPFTLKASAPDCNGVATSSMAYSTDNNSDSSPFDADTFSTSVSTSGLATGWHILRVKAWAGSNYCESDVQFNVPPTNGLTPASTAKDLPQLEQNLPYTRGYGSCPNDGATDPQYIEWQTQPDCISPGTGSTSTGYGPAVPTYGGEWESREFILTPVASGGDMRFVDPAGYDDSATHFLYDVWVYFPTQTDVDNLREFELDVNHVVNSPSGLFYELSVQCSDSAGRWQISPNAVGWSSTDQDCTVSSEFTPGTWHHIQVESEHGADGATNIKYDSVAVDGNVIPLTCNGGGACTGAAVSKTGWESTIGPNFQMDSTTQYGTVHVYTSAFNIFYW
jgi:hypothetical protein